MQRFHVTIIIIVMMMIEIMIIITTTATTTTRTIIMIAFKGAVRDFLQSSHCASNCLHTYAQVAKAQSYANHVQHIERLSRATCRVPLGTKGQLSY